MRTTPIAPEQEHGIGVGLGAAGGATAGRGIAEGGGTAGGGAATGGGIASGAGAAGGAAADAGRLLSGWTPPNARQDAVRADFLAFLAEHGRRAAERDLRVGHLTASTLLLDDAREQVLLTLHPLAGKWFQLGGHIEPGDTTVAHAAAREAAEESGIAGISLGPDPINLDVHATTCRDSSRGLGPSVHWDIQHVAFAPPGAPARRSDESLDLAWFRLDELPDGADDVVRGLVARVRDLGHA
jgi:8-oxo-dGTP pyrophosphatase MutT (NUDIX family)